MASVCAGAVLAAAAGDVDGLRLVFAGAVLADAAGEVDGLVGLASDSFPDLGRPR